MMSLYIFGGVATAIVIGGACVLNEICSSRCKEDVHEAISEDHQKKAVQYQKDMKEGAETVREIREESDSDKQTEKIRSLYQ